MKSSKLISFSFVMILGLATSSLLSGCGITIATVAGVTAYEMTKSDNDSKSIAKKMEQKFTTSYFAIALKDKNMVIAGQVPNDETLQQVKIYLAKNFNDVTQYSYLTIEAAESQELRTADTLLNKRVQQLLSEQNITEISPTSCNNTVYLLTSNKVTPDQVDKISDKVMQLKGVVSVIIIHET